MHPPGTVRRTVRAIALTAAVVLSIPITAASALAAPARTATIPASQPDAASPPSHQAVHPTVRGCPAKVPAGVATCLYLKRTDVRAHKGLFAAATVPSGFGPADLQSAYALPSASAGSGQTVAIVDAFDDPDAEADLQVYRAQYGLPVCDSANGCFTKVAEDGSTNYPVSNADWAGEISLDLDMVSAICPNCHILLVEASSANATDLGTAVNEAVAVGAKYVSNSYGGQEDPSDVTLDSSYYNHPGVAVTASSGDNGFGPEYPAASQYVTAVGGTTLTADSGTPRGWDETAWSEAGSGCSAYDPKPPWQTDTGCSNRTIADVSADANPNTGVAVYDSFSDLGWGVFGGTSVASPIIASTYALAGTPVAGTYPAQYPYAIPAALNDVTSGANGGCTPAYLCNAGPGYDGPTGLGTPDGVTAFKTGPHGTVSGTVTDTATGKPVTGAEVDVGDLSTVTSSAGDYTITVPAGTYTVTVKEFGYQPQTVSGVQVTGGQVTTENVALPALPSVTVSGRVADGSGHGYPLYAKVSVSGTPVATYTNPTTGRYSLTVPDNSSYTLNVDPALAGYIQSRQSITAGTSDVTQDFSPQVDTIGCSAPGYRLDHLGDTQTFDDQDTPAGWSVVNAAGSTAGWEFDNPGGQSNFTGGSGNFAVAYSDISGRNEDTELVSPVVDMTGDTSPYLEFDSDMFGWFGDSESVDVSTDGGQTWSSVFGSQGYPGTGGYDHEIIPLPMAAGKPAVQVRFHYISDDGFWWELDNVFLGNRSCDPVPGGIVEGVVTDGNTGAGIDGATVTAATTPPVTATTAPTGGDPALGNGFYYMFVPGTGTQQITAARNAYVSLDQSVGVPPSGTLRQDFTLQAGQLSVSAASVSKTVAIGASATQKVTFRDTGKAPVTVRLADNEGGFTLAGQPGGGAPVKRINGSFSPLPVKHAAAAGTAPRTAARAAAPALAPDASWAPVASYPKAVMDNAVATDPATGLVYSVGGVSSTGAALTAGYVYNPATRVWTSLPDLPQPRDASQAAFVDRKLYVTGGWDVNGDTLGVTDVYDPSAGTWSTAASIPVPVAGAGVATLDGEMYVIGGCDTVCGHAEVQVFDPAANSWSAAASYPELTGWEGCGTISGRIYCAGGTAGNSTTRDAYVYDPVTDAWSKLPPMPIDLWGMGYTAANGQLLLSGGVTNGFNTITNQGFAYNTTLDQWTPLPNSGNTDFRGGSACGFYRIGGSAQGYGPNPQGFAEQLPGFAPCDVSGASWLTESTTTFTLTPGSSKDITVTLNAADPAVNQPGTYTAALMIRDDTPYKSAAVPVRMTAEPPRSWGKIAGTVNGTACDGTTAPVIGATVQVDSASASYTLQTGLTGGYGLWLSQRSNPVTLIVSEDGWQPQTVKVKVAKGATTTASFTLKPAAC